MAKNRTCLVCGAKYKYCNTCGEYNPNETWRFLFDDEKCYDIYKIWQQYHSNELSAKGLKNSLKSFDLTAVMREDNNTMISSDIKSAFLDAEEDMELNNEVDKQPHEPKSFKKAEDFLNSENNNNKKNFKNKK